MRIETLSADRTIRVKLLDRMSFGDHPLFRDLLSELRRAKPTACILDMSGLTSIDSAGLGMLMIAHEESKKGGWTLTIQSPPEHVRKLLALACFDKILNIAA